jgi:DNA-binding response OmpR family regulator
MTDSLAGEKTIVVIEDDPSIADLVDLYLRQAGFRVLQAPTGERGLELIQQQRPDMAVLDIGLPGIDGLEVCRRRRTCPCSSSRPAMVRSIDSSGSNSAPMTM